MRRSLATIACLLFLSHLHAQPDTAALQKKNLEAFAKLYGYVRYFHPSDEGASIDWEKFAVYGAQKMLDVRNEEELLNTLRRLFSPIAPAVHIYMKNRPYDHGPAVPQLSQGYKVVAWQHLGMGTGDSRSIYKSIRINRPGPTTKHVASFAPVRQQIDGKLYAGKQLRVRAWMKVLQNNGGGKGQLWLRVDKARGRGFFYNMDDRPATANEWKQYEFMAQIDSDATAITFGVFLAGQGKLLIDDIEIHLKEDNGWKEVPVSNPSFEKSTGNAPDGWVGFGQVPAYAYELVTNDIKTGVKALSISFKTDSGTTAANIVSPLFDNYPKIGDRIKKSLTVNIESDIPLALPATAMQTLPYADTLQLTVLKREIETAGNKNLTADKLPVRLGATIISWNVFKHFFPYWQYASSDPETLLDETITRAFQDKTASDFLITLRKMTAALNDGHIWVGMDGDTSNRFSVPLVADRIENKLVITNVLDSSLRSAVKAGDVIEKADGIAANKFLENAEQLVSGSPQWKRHMATTHLFAGKWNAELTLLLRRDKKLTELKLKRLTPFYAVYSTLVNEEKSRVLKDGIYYLNLDKISYDEIKELMPELQKSKAIICDLRGYPNNNHALLEHLVKKPIDTKWMFVPQITRPGFESVTYAEYGWQLRPADQSINAPVVFITDARAISYAESFMSMVKDHKIAPIVGQPTAGTNGNINRFTLPGNYSLVFTGMVVKNHDGSQHHITGTVPDVLVEKTIGGVIGGKDEFLERAIKFVETGK